MYKRNCFLTLTYDEKLDTYHNNFEYSDIQKFKKRMRSYVTRLNGSKIEIFNVHEYGKNGKKHWHLIVFGFDFTDKEIHSIKNGLPLYTSAELSKLWTRGHSAIGDVSEASAMYQAQYMEKDVRNNNQSLGRRSHSKHSGIGKSFFLKNYRQVLQLGYIPFNGKKMPVPRYFQRLAEKHYSHFYEPAAFFDTPSRKAKFRPFKREEPNKEIADLYLNFKETKQTLVEELETSFTEVLNLWRETKADPEFVKSGSNVLYDHNNRKVKERF